MLRYLLPISILFASWGCATKPGTNEAAAKEAAKTIQPSQTSTLRSLKDRIEHPDPSMTFVPQGTGFTANRSYNGKSAYVKDFYVNQKPYVKSFRSNSWWGSKPDPQTEKSFRTKEARSKDYRTEEYSTEDYGTREWYYAKKATPVEGYGTDEFAGRGKKQDEFDRQMEKAPPRTIDDVRALLNKNE